MKKPNPFNFALVVRCRELARAQEGLKLARERVALAKAAVSAIRRPARKQLGR